MPLAARLDGDARTVLPQSLSLVRQVALTGRGRGGDLPRPRSDDLGDVLADQLFPGIAQETGQRAVGLADDPLLVYRNALEARIEQTLDSLVTLLEPLEQSKPPVQADVGE